MEEKQSGHPLEELFGDYEQEEKIDTEAMRKYNDLLNREFDREFEFLYTLSDIPHEQWMSVYDGCRIAFEKVEFRKRKMRQNTVEDISTVCQKLQTVLEILLKNYALKLGAGDPAFTESVNKMNLAALIDDRRITNDQLELTEFTKSAVRRLNGFANFYKHGGSGTSASDEEIRICYAAATGIACKIAKKLEKLETKHPDGEYSLSVITEDGKKKLTLLRNELGDRYERNIRWAVSNNNIPPQNEQGFPFRTKTLDAEKAERFKYIHILLADMGGKKLSFVTEELSINKTPLTGELELSVIQENDGLFLSVKKKASFPVCFNWYTINDGRLISKARGVSRIRITDDILGNNVFCTAVCSGHPGRLTASISVTHFIRNSRSKPEKADSAVQAAQANASASGTAAVSFSLSEADAAALRARISYFVAPRDEVFAARSLELLDRKEYLSRRLRAQGFGSISFYGLPSDSEDCGGLISEIASFFAEHPEGHCAAVIPAAVLCSKSLLPEGSPRRWVETILAIPETSRLVLLSEDRYFSAFLAPNADRWLLGTENVKENVKEFIGRIGRERMIRLDRLPAADETERLLLRLKLDNAEHFRAVPYSKLGALAEHILSERNSGSGEWQYNSLAELRALLCMLTPERLGDICSGLKKVSVKAKDPDSRDAGSSVFFRKLRRDVILSGRIPEGSPYTDDNARAENLTPYFRNTVVRTEVIIDGQKMTGTAFIVSPEGYAVTCAHNVADKKDLNRVVMRGRAQMDCLPVPRKYEFSVVNVRPQIDLALIKLESPEPMKYMLLADNNEPLRVFEECIFLGFPAGRDGLTGTKVMISTENENRDNEPGGVYNITYPIANPDSEYHGDSGAPIISNRRGEEERWRVVGVFRGGSNRQRDTLNYIKGIGSFITEFLRDTGQK